MKARTILLVTAAVLACGTAAAQANERYRTRPPVVLSPDLSAPWVMQLRAPGGEPVRRIKRARTLQSIVIGAGTGVAIATTSAAPRIKPSKRMQMRDVIVVPAAAGAAPDSEPRREMDSKFLPQVVDYDGSEKPGSIVIDTSEKFLYLVEADGKARRYGVGVGKEGFSWSGTQKISQKRQWPDWRPPAEMIKREKKKGRILPAHMAGGPENPLGARAMYLGGTLYRIHGTNQPWSIGTAVSSGCIRMRNEDVTDLYDRVNIGTTVIVR